MANKTRDGIRLRTVLSALEKLTGITIRSATNHKYVASMAGYTIPCPIASSTNARTMIVPWIRAHTSYSNAQQIYQALRKGKWPT
ncbi:MAG: hypothetical protein ABH864_02395 [archaeon]